MVDLKTVLELQLFCGCYIFGMGVSQESCHLPRAGCGRCLVLPLHRVMVQVGKRATGSRHGCRDFVLRPQLLISHAAKVAWPAISFSHVGRPSFPSWFLMTVWKRLEYHGVFGLVFAKLVFSNGVRMH